MPLSVRNRKRYKHAKGFVARGFSLCTGVTGFDIVLNKGSKLVSSNQFHHFGNTKMTSKGGVMKGLQDVKFGKDIWDIEEAFLKK